MKLRVLIRLKFEKLSNAYKNLYLVYSSNCWISSGIKGGTFLRVKCVTDSQLVGKKWCK